MQARLPCVDVCRDANLSPAFGLQTCVYSCSAVGTLRRRPTKRSRSPVGETWFHRSSLVVSSPRTPFPDSFTVADNPGTMRVRLKSDRGWIKLKWRAIEMHPVQQVTITLVGAERFKIRLSVHSSKVRITLGQSRLEKLEHPVRLSEGSVVDGKTDW